MISAFDLFKIGIRPSSSHTIGPMVAARRFRERISRLPGTVRITAEIFGSLAWTGRGTDLAIFLGLLGHEPATVDPDRATEYVAALAETGELGLPGIRFDCARDLIFNLTEILPRHTNGMRFRAFDAADTQRDEVVCFSIGGGFVEEEGEATLATLDANRLSNSRPAHEIMDWISLYALAVNEENAAGGRIVPRRPTARRASSRRCCATSWISAPAGARRGGAITSSPPPPSAG